MFWMYNNKIIRLFKSPGVYTGRGGHSRKVWVVMCLRGLQTLTQFITNGEVLSLPRHINLFGYKV